MVAVAEGRAGDAARDGVDGIDAGVALVRQAGAPGCRSQLVDQRLVDFLCLIPSAWRNRHFNARAGSRACFDAGAGPWAHAEVTVSTKPRE